MADVLLPSAQSLLVELWYDQTPLGTATAFVVISDRGPMLVTARHVVTGRHQQTGQPVHNMGAVPNILVVHHNQEGKLGAWVAHRQPLYDGNGRALWFEHPDLLGRADIAALPVVFDKPGGRFYPHEMADPAKSPIFRPTDIVSVVGFPFGLRVGKGYAVWATGFVASEPTVPFDDLPMFLIDCRTREGQSGAAVLFHRNEGGVIHMPGNVSLSGNIVTVLLGLYSGRVRKDSDIGRVWNTDAVFATACAGVPSPLVWNEPLSWSGEPAEDRT